jgi:hypothetical protein
MWRPASGSGGDDVECVACGDTVERDAAREYDKHGDRWNRSGKSFEHLCKPCFRRECHQPRDDLESLLVDVEQSDVDSMEDFVAAYMNAVEERYGQIEE